MDITIYYFYFYLFDILLQTWRIRRWKSEKGKFIEYKIKDILLVFLSDTQEQQQHNKLESHIRYFVVYFLLRECIKEEKPIHENRKRQTIFFYIFFSSLFFSYCRGQNDKNCCRKKMDKIILSQTNN